MAPDELIPAREFCTFHHVELSFIQHLHDAGLIGMTVMDGSFFLSVGELPVVEKFARWHYELAINSEGIEALSHVLQRMQRLLDENRALRDRLRRYEHGAGGHVEPAVEL
ncbi:MAG TPA: chaperone modulator CbpM [Puia sp.]|nr:chaperone modulator CbpM [Puia sp.]